MLIQASWANPLERWQWRHPQPQGLALHAVTFGGGLFVAVGEAGTIVTSSDAYHWTNQITSPFPNLNGIAYSCGLYAAVGDGGTILISTNGTDWTLVASGVTSQLRAVAGNSTGPLRFMAVGADGTSLLSGNGLSWTNVPTGVTNHLNALVYEAGYFDAVGDAGTVLVYDIVANHWFTTPSPTRLNFTAITISDSGDYLASCDGIFFDGGGASASSAVLLSPDLYSWTAVVTNQPYGGTIRLVGLTNGKGVSVGVGYPVYTIGWLYPGVIMTSKNASQWIGLSSSTSEYHLNGVTCANGLFVAVGEEGEYLFRMTQPIGLTSMDTTPR